MGRLILIATRHDDYIKGPVKLMRVYKQIRPDMLLQEMSDVDLEFYHGMCGRVESDFRRLSDDSAGVDNFMFLFRSTLGFEGMVNRTYAAARGIPNHKIDLPGRHIKFFEKTESVMRQTIEGVMSSEGELDMKRWYSSFFEDRDLPHEKVRETWEGYVADEGTPKGEQTLERVGEISCYGQADIYMESRIRELYDPEKVIAFPTGMLHALESMNGTTLYSRIKDLNPERIPLL